MGRAIVESDERHRQEIGRLREAHSNESRATQRHVSELRKEIARMLEREDADELLAEAEAAGTRKGRTFEERVHAAIERIAEARGDCAHHVGDEPGDGGSKKGDTVVEIGAAEAKPLGRIVFEDKDDQLSRNRAWEELNAAMAERHADFAVLVVAGEENIPAKREQLVEYEGNKVIVAVDPELPDGSAWSSPTGTRGCGCSPLGIGRWTWTPGACGMRPRQPVRLSSAPRASGWR